jgi:HK97 family phage portal protein
MRLFGLNITRETKALPASLSPPSDRGWVRLIAESFAGAWQQNVEIRLEDVLGHSAVYACVSLIAADISKLRLKLVSQDENGIWSEIKSSAFSPVINKPNRYQTRITFYEQWIASKLIHGNTYVLKQRDNRNVVSAMYILDPTRVKPLVADDGEVFYELSRDNLSGVQDEYLIVPASEIIHDLMVPLYHPLVGVSPIYACGLSAIQGRNIQTYSTKFFENQAQPGGILTAPGNIPQETADRIKYHWQQNYTGNNAGKVAVLGDGLKFERMATNAVDAQLIDQLKLSAEAVCSCFHVPPYMIGVGPMPSYNNIQALTLAYYSQCLQKLIESLELCLDEGLELTASGYGTWFDEDNLLRMDTATLLDTTVKGISGSLFTTNEGRRKFEMKPVEGGDSIRSQQQYYDIEALAERDRNDPFAKPAPSLAPPAATPALPAPSNEEEKNAGRRYVRRDLSGAILRAARQDDGRVAA